ncbi:hypothetical protein JYT33_00130 [Alkaliphilus transvaalensis]|nr:hypothetical protein [Alkaliphilus transvaalensis]
MKMSLIFILLMMFLITGCQNEIPATEEEKTSLLDTPPTEAIARSEDQNEVADEKAKKTTMLKSIEVIEDTKNLKLIFTSHYYNITTFMKDFIIEYFDDYYELRFSNSNKRLFEEETLVHNDNISDIADSKFIKRWYKTFTTISHSTTYSILFNNPIEYTIEEKTNPGKIVITISKSTENLENLYILRSPSLDLRELWIHIYETAGLTLDLDLHFRILKNAYGYFYPVKSFKSKNEAEDYKIKILEEHDPENSLYSSSYNRPYNLIIESQSDF